MKELAEKWCSFCGCVHPLTSEHWSRLDTYPRCKLRARDYVKKNLDKLAKNSLAYYHAHKENYAEHRRAYGREYYQRTKECNREQRLEKSRARYKKHSAKYIRQKVEKYQSDIGTKLANHLRSRLRHALKNNSKKSSMLSLLGCSILEFRAHLERQFAVGMSWENYGRGGWSIDHIRPLAGVDLSCPMQLAAISHYSNLQPMWECDNIKKGAKLYE